MRKRLLYLLAGLGAATLANAAIKTEYVDLEKFTDFSVSGGKEEQARKIFENELARAGRLQSIVGEGRTLELTITDIDMAGEIEPWRNRQNADIRYVRSVYPPRMSFSYVLLGENGEELASGEESIRDLSFDFNISLSSNRPTFHYELEMLETWARKNLPRTQN